MIPDLQRLPAFLAALGSGLIAGSFAYLLGCLFVTMTRNVPMNKALARVAAGSPQAAQYQPEYVSRWTLWSHGGFARSHGLLRRSSARRVRGRVLQCSPRATRMRYNPGNKC